jgi:thiol-disulfide isomerase/thioredoxin
MAPFVNGSQVLSAAGRWTRALIVWSGASKRFAPAIALAIVFALVGACSSRAKDASRSREPTATERGATVAIPNSGVFSTDVEHFKRVLRSGDVPTIVNAWASWCIPCRAEMPLFVKAADRYEGEIRFLGLNTQDDKEAALAFIDEFDIPFPSGLDPRGIVGRDLKLLGLPATLFYRPGGELAIFHQGEIRSQQLNEKIEELLRSSRSEPP